MMTIQELGIKRRREYGTEQNECCQFLVGTRVKVVSPCVDFNFFFGETGTVVECEDRYLGIKVEFDKLRCFRDGTIQEDFYFNPRDLVELDDNERRGFIRDLRGL